MMMANTCSSKKLRNVKYRRMKRKMFFNGKILFSISGIQDARDRM
jgi:hypothetical protein